MKLSLLSRICFQSITLLYLAKAHQACTCALLPQAPEPRPGRDSQEENQHCSSLVASPVSHTQHTLCHVDKQASRQVPLPGFPGFPWGRSISVINHSWTAWATPSQGRLVPLSHIFVVSSCSWPLLLQLDAIFMLRKPSKKMVVFAAQRQECPLDRFAILILILACGFVCYVPLLIL